MPLQPPTVGAEPLPVEGNVNKPNRLRSNDPPRHCDPSAQRNRAKQQCERCTDFFELYEGYVLLDSFYCDDCTEELAEAGEFCCGS